MPADDELIAIVAMECRVPGAANVDEFWQLLVDGESALTELSDDELTAAGVPAEERERADYVRTAGVLRGVAEFDSGYFGYASGEADVLDVQQRLLLEMSVSLLEKANIDPQRTRQRIGVFAGSGLSTYLAGVLQNPRLVDSLGEMVVRHGNDKDFLATRISYKLDLRGPSLNVQTACSTGLVAVHSGVQSLLLNECDAAVAGAAYVRVPQHAGYRHRIGGVLSPDGVCRPFDADANGTIFTNGLGLVLLKRLPDAIADGDEIHAVIAGSAINNDGAQKVSYTAPSVTGQVDVLRDALAVSGAEPDDLAYLEAHGTGTALGDPVEVEAIKQAYGTDGSVCRIGSLKGNVGHLNIAAGIVSLIKAALVLKHRYVPPTVNVREVNAALELDGSRYVVATEGTPLDGEGPAWAGVSAFGMGGTNAHVVLREFDGPPAEPTEPAASGPVPSILTLSAKSEGALRRQAVDLAQHIAANPDRSIAEYAFTLRQGRARRPHRAALVATDRAEAISRLKAERYHVGPVSAPGPIAFVFAGQGTQRAGMGAALAARNPTFAGRLAEAVAAADGLADVDLRSLLVAGSGDDVTHTAVAQPLLFAVEYALAMALTDSGVRPDYLLGHSLGEVVAATVAGVFDLRSATALVAARAKAMARCEPGAMLAVDRAEPFAELIESAGLAVAARNSPRQIVLSGTFAAVEAAAAKAVEEGVHHQRVATSHAFHSPMMTSGAAEFLEFLSSCSFAAPQTPIVSNITGQLLTEYEVRNPHYWAEHLVRSIDFAGSVETLRLLGVTRFVEIGSGRSMSNFVRAGFGAADAPKPDLVAALGAEPEHELESFTDAVALGWTCDPAVPIEEYTQAGRMIPLPTYPFDKKVHWVEQAAVAHPVVAASACDAAPAPPSRPTSDRTADRAEEAPPPADVGDLDDATAEIRAVVAKAFEVFVGSAVEAVDTGFFELGGNSLMAIQLINTLRETFGLDLSVRDFYENSSVAATTDVVTALLLEEPAHV